MHKKLYSYSLYIPVHAHINGNELSEQFIVVILIILALDLILFLGPFRLRVNVKQFSSKIVIWYKFILIQTIYR